jgi:hypothetical protein
MGKRKAVERARSGPSTKKRKNHINRAEWILKYRDFVPSFKTNRSFEVNADGIPLLRCVKCGESKERTTDFFTAAGVNGNLQKWFANPFPYMQNNPTHPCNACWAAMLLIVDRDTVGDGWLHSLLRPYKLSLEWAQAFYRLADGEERCRATGGTLSFQKGSDAFSLSVNSTVIQTEGAYSNKIWHGEKFVEPVYRFANCMQTVLGAGVTKVVIIPSLREAYAELYRRKIDAYRVGTAEMRRRGDAKAAIMKASADFDIIAQHARRSDMRCNLSNNMSSVRILEMVRKHHAICCTSGTILDSLSTNKGDRGPYDVHMDRIEDGFSVAPKGHVDTNVEFKCRMFNNDQHISPKDFVLLFMNQVLVPLPPDVRILAQADYDAMPCTPRDAWRHEI